MIYTVLRLTSHFESETEQDPGHQRHLGRLTPDVDGHHGAHRNRIGDAVPILHRQIRVIVHQGYHRIAVAVVP